MREFLEISFSGPVLPATALLILVSFYWLLVILGAFELDMFDFDLDADADVSIEGPLAGVGFAVLRFLNIGRVPIMIWISVFALSLWTISVLLDGRSGSREIGEAALLFLRNAGIAVVAAKLLTYPLQGKFDTNETPGSEALLGRIGVVTTSEVTASFGQVRLPTDGAPLLLNVRAEEGTLARGDEAELVRFDAEKGVYYVRSPVRSGEDRAAGADAG